MRIVLLRGLAREAAHWGDFPARLQGAWAASHRAAAPPQVLSPDCPGCGVFFREKAATRMSRNTDHVRRQVWQAQGDCAGAAPAGEKLLLVGLSMGGMVALDWAQRFPEEVAGLVVINSSLGWHPLHWRLRPRAWCSALRALLVSRDAREAIMLNLVSNQRERYAENIRHWQSIQARRPVSRRTIVSQLFAAARLTSLGPEALAALPMSGCVLASATDRMVSVRCSEALARATGWPLHLHPSAGHDIPLDDAAWVIEHIVSGDYDALL